MQQKANNMWKDLSYKERAALINQWHKEHVIDYRSKKAEYDMSISNKFEDGGSTNPMGYEYQGPVTNEELRKQLYNEGIDVYVPLPEGPTITAQKPDWMRTYSSSFDGHQELLEPVMEFTPGLGDAIDAYNAVRAAEEGSYIEAGMLGAGLLLPNALEKPVKLLRNKFGREAVESAAKKVVKERPKLIPDTDGKPYYAFDDIPDNIKINRAPEGKYHHQDELKLDGDYDFTEGHINDGAGHISPREYAKQFSEAFANAKHGQAVAFLKDDDLSFDSYADLASFLAKQQKRGKVKIVKADGAPVQMKLNGLGKNKFPNKETRASDMNAFLDKLNEKYGTSFSHVTDKSEFVPYPPALQKLQGREGWTRSSFWLDPIVAVKLNYGGYIK